MRLWLLLAIAGLCGCNCCFNAVTGLNGELIGAARSGEVSRIRPLIEAGADPNATGGVNGWTVLMHAVHKNQPAVVHELLARGANPNVLVGRGTSALGMAAGYGQTEIVAALLDAGADPRQKLADGKVALDYAITGVTDIDDWTAGRCQTATVRRLVTAAPDVVTPSLLERTRSQQRQCDEIRSVLTSMRAE